MVALVFDVRLLESFERGETNPLQNATQEQLQALRDRVWSEESTQYLDSRIT